MCDCNEKKDCCDCFKGGCECERIEDFVKIACECDCACTCHTDRATDPCRTSPRLSCPECITAHVTAKALSVAMLRIDPNILPDDKAVKKMLDTLPL